MLLAHAGFAAAVLGATVVSQYSVETELRMEVGSRQTVAGYDFEFVSVARNDGPNYRADQATFAIWREGARITTLEPQKRQYLASRQVMTEAAIDAGVFRDLFVAMGDPIGDGSWAMRLQYKPMIRWIWGGVILMGVGAMVTVLDRRYRAKVNVSSSQTQPVGTRKYGEVREPV
jgi:cytochrome c-type biogenesis protein CcmF